MRVIVSVSLDSDLLLQVNQITGERDLSRSAVFQEALGDWIRKKSAPVIEPQKARKPAAKKNANK